MVVPVPPAPRTSPSAPAQPAAATVAGVGGVETDGPDLVISVPTVESLRQPSHSQPPPTAAEAVAAAAAAAAVGAPATRAMACSSCRREVVVETDPAYARPREELTLAAEMHAQAVTFREVYL